MFNGSVFTKVGGGRDRELQSASEIQVMLSTERPSNIMLSLNPVH
jgi:hypothetical protein